LFNTSCVYLNKVTSYIDQRLPVVSIYLDFSKAFERMKLNGESIGGGVSRWTSTWLADRVERVDINGLNSERSPVRSLQSSLVTIQGSV